MFGRGGFLQLLQKELSMLANKDVFTKVGREESLVLIAATVGWCMALIGTHKFIQIGLDARANGTDPQATAGLVVPMFAGFIIANIALSYVFRRSTKLTASGKDKQRSLYFVAWGALLALMSLITYFATPISLGMTIMGIIRSRSVNDMHIKRYIRSLAFGTIAALIIGSISMISLR